MSTSRMKKIERSKLSTLSPSQITEMRQKQRETIEASRKAWRQRHQKRTQWGRNEYVDDDFVSRMLVKWTLAQLVQYSKLLLILINRRTSRPSDCTLPSKLASLVYYKYPSEYYETLFADYTPLGGETGPCFRVCYTQAYKEAVKALEESQNTPLTHEQRLYHGNRLRGFFMVALVYDARIRRFTFSKHDIHYDYMHTHPPPMKKTTHFILRLQPCVDQCIQGLVDIQTLADEACKVWLEHYMFLLE